jgi:triacylglycerol esterase/lipase EstA (alpha/beta hydrolase family)
MISRIRLAVALACVAGAIAAAPSAASAAAPAPPGSNVACSPTAAHPYPVILVHGTLENQFDNWLAMAPALKSAGYCVYSFNYGPYAGSGSLGIYGTGPIETSAKELATEVATVRAQTGAAKVDLVGHSQGGMMPRYYLKNLGGAAVVDDLVALSPSNHGTTNPIAVPAGVICPACAQQAAGSSFITALNSGDETPGAVSYTNIATKYDEVVTPYTSDFLAAGPQVTNILLQAKCPTDTSEHLRTPYDAAAIAITKNALGRSGPADAAFKPACQPV